MANLLDKYGIKEVADVTFFEVNSGTTNWSKPILFLDTLKVSTIEQSAENVSARGGKGNPELVSWDYGKEITLTLEDALFSAKSLAFMFGKNIEAKDTNAATITKAVKIADLTVSGTNWKLKGAKKGITDTDISVSSIQFVGKDGSIMTSNPTTLTAALSSAQYAVVTMSTTNSVTIEISADKFPGTYTIVGDTYARPQGSSYDEYFQFIIPTAKVNSNVTFTLEAEGDPTTFNMEVRVLRPDNGTMMKLVKYDFGS